MIRPTVDGFTQKSPAILEIPSKEHPYDPEQDAIHRRTNIPGGKTPGAAPLTKPSDGLAVALAPASVDGGPPVRPESAEEKDTWHAAISAALSDPERAERHEARREEQERHLGLPNSSKTGT